MQLLSVVVLTFNEGKHIARALRSLAPLDAQIFVVDSFSTDATVEIARAEGALVVQHTFVHQAQQMQWALLNMPITTAWVMRLDADEVLTTELIDEIKHRLPILPSEVTGINLKRRHIFLGRWIRHGGRYPVTLLRIWRRGAARVEQRWMDEHMVLLRGQAVTFRHDFSDENLNDLTHFTDKHNKYATREAVEVLSAKFGMAEANAGIAARHGSFQALAKRTIKESLYNRLPLWCGPLGYFLTRYIVQGGALDGRAGLIYHTLQGFWYRFLVAAKTVEFEQHLRTLSTPDERLSTLERISGLPLRSQSEAPRPAAGHAQPAVSAFIDSDDQVTDPSP